MILILAILAIHPLIGLPMLAFYLLMMSVTNFKLLADYQELKFGLPTIIFILSAGILPAIFIIFLIREKFKVFYSKKNVDTLNAAGHSVRAVAWASFISGVLMPGASSFRASHSASMASRAWFQ